MSEAQATDSARHSALRIPLPAALAALGIVYGDIGTSPLYAFKQAADSGGPLSPETITGIVSLILWSLIMIISVKYAILIMRADNRGEGGLWRSWRFSMPDMQCRAVGARPFWSSG
jgi:KUP system potassium uptake protein